MSLLLVAAAAALAASQPPPVTADAAAQARCPLDAVNRLYLDLGRRLSKAERAQVLNAYDRAVAEWAVCAHLNGIEVWGVPPAGEPMAQKVLAAAQSAPGSRERVEGLALAAKAMPEAVAALAVEDLAVLRTVALGEPAARAELVAAALGAWACPEAVEWFPGPDDEPMGVCTDGRGIDRMAVDGLQRLVDLAAPAAKRGHWLCDAVRPYVDKVWVDVEEVWIPLPQAPPDLLAAGGAGPELVPGIGWAWTLTRDGLTWQRRAAIRVTSGGIETADTTPEGAGGTLPPKPEPHPDTVESLFSASPGEAPLVHVAADVPVRRVDEVLAATGALRPTFSAKGANGPVELRLFWTRELPGVWVPALDLGPDRVEALLQARQAAGFEGPVWIVADPDATWATLVLAVAALYEMREPPVVVSAGR